MFLISLLFFVNPLSASTDGGGHTVRNGGSYVLCANETDSDIMFNGKAIFDVFEIKDAFDYTYTELAKFRGKQFESVFPSAVRRFFGRNVELQSELLRQFSSFSKNVTFVDHVEPIGLGTLSWRAMMRGCSIHYAAVQTVPTRSESNQRFTIQIDRAVWKSLATDQKITLMIHEYLEAVYYRYVGECAFQRGLVVTGSILSDQVIKMKIGEWNDHLDFNCDTYRADVNQGQSGGAGNSGF